MLPYLQSVTIVFLKIILTNISATANQMNCQNGSSMRYSKQPLLTTAFLTCIISSNIYPTTNGRRPGKTGLSSDFDSCVAVGELDGIRLREITGKAVSACLLLMVKWFKRSRKHGRNDNTGFQHRAGKLTCLNRYIEIRIHDSTVAGLELPTFDSQDVCPSRYRPGDCTKDRSRRPGVRNGP